MFTLSTILAFTVALLFYAICSSMLHKALTIHLSPRPRLDWDHFTFRYTGTCHYFRNAARMTNLVHNRQFVAAERHSKFIAYICLQQCFRQLDINDYTRRTPTAMWNHIRDQIGIYHKELFNQHTRCKKTLEIANLMYEVFYWERKRYYMFHDGDTSHSTINIPELLRELDPHLIKFKNKDIINPYHQFDTSPDNYLVPVFKDIVTKRP